MTDTPEPVQASIRKNITANVVGSGWPALLALAFIPLYIKLIGIEAYGLVGFSTVFISLMSRLDFGLSTALGRELVRYSAQGGGRDADARDLVRSLELIFWALGVVAVCATAAVAPTIARLWLNADQLSDGTVVTAIRLIGLMFACQFPFAIYQGGLIGLDRQVLLNGLVTTMATLRSIGALIVLWLVSPTIEAFFIWQAFVGLLQTVSSACCLWRGLPPAGGRPHVRKDLLGGLWRYAAGMTVLSTLQLAIVQVPVLLLSKVLSLEDYGYFTLALNVAFTVLIGGNAIQIAVFPRFARYHEMGDTAQLAALYHRMCQFTAASLVPLCAVMCWFAADLLMLWTDDPLITKNAAPLLALLALLAMLRTVVNIPFALQYASGHLRPALISVTAALIAIVPLMLLLTDMYSGAAGVIAAWGIAYMFLAAIMMPMVHRELLPGELISWAFVDCGIPVVVACGSCAAAQCVVPAGLSRPMLLLATAAVTCVAMLLTALATPLVRPFVTGYSQHFCRHRTGSEKATVSSDDDCCK